MEKNNAIKKINTLGKVSNIVIIIAKILLIIGFVLTLLAGIVTLIIPKGMLKVDLSATANVIVDLAPIGESFTEEEQAELVDDFTDEFHMEMELNGSRYESDTIEVTDTTVEVESMVDLYTLELRDLTVVAFLGALTFALLFVTLVFAGRLSKAFRDCESPFDEKIIKGLQGLAYSLIPWAVMNTLTDSVTESILTNNVHVVLGIDLGMLVIIFFIFILAFIFKYGAVLQQESDETL